MWTTCRLAPNIVEILILLSGKTFEKFSENALSEKI